MWGPIMFQHQSRALHLVALSSMTISSDSCSCKLGMKSKHALSADGQLRTHTASSGS